MSTASSTGGTERARQPAPTSWRLIERARSGDSRALGELLCRYLPPLRRWARGRLSRHSRTVVDTTDILHDALVGTLRHMPSFEVRSRRALAAYLRQAVRNRIHDEHRRLRRHGVRVEVQESLVDGRPSPFDLASTHAQEVRYRAALARLRPNERELIVAHVELGYTHEQLGCMTGRSPNAARMALQRAVERLARFMRHG